MITNINRTTVNLILVKLTNLISIYILIYTTLFFSSSVLSKFTSYTLFSDFSPNFFFIVVVSFIANSILKFVVINRNDFVFFNFLFYSRDARFKLNVID